MWSKANFQMSMRAWDEFGRRYEGLSHRQFVEKVYANAGAALSDEDARSLADALGSGRKTRADVLFALAADEGFARRSYDEDFVRLNYFAFLRRDPDPSGLAGWLRVLRETHDYESVTGGITASTEYVDAHGPR